MKRKGNGRFRLYSWMLVLIGLLVGGIAWQSTGAQAAESFDLFVSKSRVENVVEGKTVFAPVGEFLKALGFQWTPAAGGYELSRGSGGGPEIRTRRFQLTYGGNVIQPQTLLLRGQVYVAVKQVAEGVGATYIDTPSVGVAQVLFPTAPITERDLAHAIKVAAARPMPEYKPTPLGNTAGSGKSPAAGTASPGAPLAVGSTNPDEDPLQVDKMDFVNPIIPNSKVPAQLTGTAVVKNKSEETVHNVRITVDMMDLGDNLIEALPTKYISQLGPGESTTQDFMWYNYYNQSVTPKVKIEHDPLPKKETPTASPSAKPSGPLTPEVNTRPGYTPSPSPSASPSDGASPGGTPSKAP